MKNNELQNWLKTRYQKCNRTFDWKTYEDMRTLDYYLILVCPDCKERHIYENTLAIMLENEFRRKNNEQPSN